MAGCSGHRPGHVIDTVFVYGTLRPGCGAFPFVEPDVVRTADGTLEGHRLVGWGRPYPWCVASSDPEESVIGTVLWLREPAKVLARLDAYEGVQGPDREYRRGVRPVTTSNDTLDCWVYLGRVVPESALEVPGGDWLSR